MAAANAARFVVQVGLGGINALLRGSRLATGAISSLVSAFGTLISVIGSVTAAIGIVSGAFTAFILINARTIDSIGKISTVVGLSTDLIQKFGFAAEQTGVSFEQSSVALRRFSRRLGEAQRGTGELLPALRRLGINTKNADGSFKDAEQVLFEFADGLQATRGESARLSLAFKAFDSEGAELVATLENGADALKEVFDEAERLGFVLNRGTIKEVENFNDSFNVLVNIVKGAVRQFIGALAPALNTINNDLAELVKTVSKGEESFRSLGEFLKNTFFDGLISILNTINSLVPRMKRFANLFINIANSIGLTEDKDIERIKNLVNAIKDINSLSGGGAVGPTVTLPNYNELVVGTVALAQALKDLGIEAEGIDELLDLNFGEKLLLSTGLGIDKIKAARDELVKLTEPIIKIYEETGGGEPLELFDDEQSETIRTIVEYLERLRDATGTSVEYVKEFKVATVETNRELDLTLTKFQRFVLDIKDVFTKTIPETFESIMDFIDSMIEKLRELGVGDAMKTLEDGFVKAAQMFEDALADAIVNGKADFSKLGDHIRQVLAKALVQKFITGPLLSLFNLPGLASGGPAKAGQPYIIGEEGPELFVPGQSGTVIPNNQLQGSGGMAATTVNYNIQAVDAPSFQALVARDPEFIFNVSRAGARRQPA